MADSENEPGPARRCGESGTTMGEIKCIALIQRSFPVRVQG
jgi:hypothetical protein